jgi:hypothetical protein
MISFRCRLASAFVAITLAAATGVALAQTTAPAAPTVTPTPNCEKPGDPPSMTTSELAKSAAEMKRSNWTKNMKAYLECVKRFIDEHQAAAAPHVRAANAAVDEYNKSIKTFNEQVEAARPQ